MGKTAFVLSLARNAAVTFNRPVAFFSLEMSSIQLVNRLISSETEINTEQLRKGQLSEMEWKQLNTKISALTNAPIFIDDTPSLTIFELRAKCRRLAAEKKISMIIIDYLQLMQGSMDNNKGGNREQEISHISRSLKSIAKELNIPIIALSQLSREVEKRGTSKRPQLSDLRESGAIEQDADMVMFIYRPEYYGLNETEDHQPTDNLAEIIVAKNRNGALKTVNLKFIGRLTKFEDADHFDFVDETQRAIPPNTAALDQGRVTRNSRMNDMKDEGLMDTPF
jgi:replicative DNA helicase